MFQSRKTKIIFGFFALIIFVGVGLLFASHALAQAVDTGVDTVGSATGLSTTDIRITIGNIIRYILGFLGVIALILVLYGGFLYMTSGGNQEKTTKAKKVLIDAAIGLIIIFSAYAIASYVINKLGAATGAVGFESSGSNDGRSGGLEASGELAFVARSITPKGDLDNYNVKVRVLFSQIVSSSTITADNISITKHGESAAVPCTKEVAGSLAILTPEQKCPAPDDNLHCFDKNSDYDIQLKAGAIKANSGALGLACEPAAACQAHFRTGGNLDKQGPVVTIEKPLDNAKVRPESSVDINVYAKDDSGVSNISFYVDNNSIAINGPENGNTRKDFYSGVVWDTSGARLGSHAIEAAADDTAGNSGSKKITVSILPAACFNSEGGIKCGGTGCPKCDGASCRSNADCSGECLGGVCVSLPTITNVLPNEAAPGNLISIIGSGFKSYDAAKSKVYFIGSGGEYVEAKVGCQGKQSWTDNTVVVQVPDNAAAGPVKIVNKDNKYDTTENDRGWKGDFTRNDVLNYPGLCSVLLSGCDATCAGASCADCQSGLMNQSVVAQGLGFGGPSGTSKVYFGDMPAQLGTSAVWLANKITDIKIPNLDPGQTNVSIGIGEKCFLSANATKTCDKGADGCSCADVYSNPVKFKINESANLPKIQSINPNPAPAGQYVTISGANFGNSVGRVQFVSMQGEAIPASLPCANSGWSTSDVVVKVPSGLTVGVDYSVLLYTSDNVASNTKLFTASAGAPGPGICSISPDNGPIGTAVDFKGENFGTASAYSIMFAKTGLDNDLGVAVSGQDIGAWTDTEISGALVPAGAVPGNVYIVNKTRNTIQSNKISFKVGSCAAGSCGADKSCCSSGVCVDKTAGQSDADACQSQTFSYDSEYAWVISTGLLPQVPRVLERSCVTGELSESPSPAKSVEDACPNAMISAAFNMLMKADSFDNNIIIKRCKTAGGKCDFSQQAGDYELARIADVKAGDIGETNLSVACRNAQSSQICAAGSTDCVCQPSGTKLTEFHLSSSLSDYVGKVATRPIAGLSYYFLYPNTWYEVKVVGGRGGASSLRDEFLPLDYVWQFKTKADVCQPENLIISPAKGLIDEIDAKQKFIIFGQYRCQNIALNNYNWLWEVLDAYKDKAEFVGFGCDADDAVCVDSSARKDIGVYQLNSGNISADGSAKIDFETPAGDPVKISASTKVTAAHRLGIEGFWDKNAELEIKFKEPRAVSYFPSCEAVCVNSTILGVTFNTNMKASTLNADNIKLYSCLNKDCAVLTPVVLNNVVYQSLTKQAQIYANANFDPNKYYRVIINNQAKSASGVGLTGLNYRTPETVVDSPNNAFSWVFKTKNDNSVCKINSVAIQPLSYVSEKQGEQVGYLSLPYASPDECSAAGQALNPYAYSWAWSSDQESVAKISLNNESNGKGSPYQSATVVGNFTNPAFHFNDATLYTEGATNISALISAESKSGATPLTFRTRQCVAGSVAIDQGAAAPKNNESNVCRNALIYILLTDKAQIGDITSGNIQLSAQYLASETCPGQPAAKNKNIIFKALAAVQNLFAKAGLAIGAKWCDVPTKSIDVTTTVGGKPEIVITPESLLPQNRLHRVLLTGLKNACFKIIPDMTLTFTTKDEACRLDNVKVDPEDNFIIKSNQSTPYKAWPRSGEQIIQKVSAKYEWTWKWTTSDSSIADFDSDNATTAYNPNINTFAKNGNAQAQAAATITVDKLGGGTDTTNTTVAGLGDIQVLICDNPWNPAENANWGVYEAKTNDGSYVSTYLFEKTNPNPMDIGLFYCRDFGSSGASDDLPKLSVSTDTSSADTNPMLMRQYFFTRDPENLGGEAIASTDVISLRIYKNEEALPPDQWYNRYAPNPATGGAKTANIDCKTDSFGQYCYVGAKDGVSTYIAGANVIGNTIYNNIYLLGYSQGANAATQNIYSQLVNLIKFNFQYQETLSGDKAAVIRDTKRVSDLVMMRAYLNQYKAAHSDSVPQLSAGTYARGQTISVWPSWQKELGSALGRTLPIDPQNHFQYTGVSAGGGRSLVAYYPMSGNADDATEHANHGVVFGAQLAPDKSASADGAYHFSGGDYIDLGTNSIFDLADGLTISAWVSHESGNGHIVNKGGGWSDSGYSIFWFNNNIRVELQDAGREKAISDNLAPSNNAWHHIAVTWDSQGKTIKTYIDGAAAGNTAAFNGPIGAGAQHLNIGRNDKHIDLDFKGKIDEVRIYNVALGAAQIKQIYDNQNIALGQESDCSATAADAASSATALKCLANYQCAVPGKWCVNCPSDYDKLTCYKSTITDSGPAQLFYDAGKNRPPESPVYMYRAIDAGNYELKYRLETKEIYQKTFHVVPAL